MEQPSYEIGRIMSGDATAITEAYKRFSDQEIDETRLAATGRVSPFPAFRRGLLGEAPVAGVGTFKGSEKQTIVFAPSPRPGWWIRREDQSEQLIGVLPKSYTDFSDELLSELLRIFNNSALDEV